MPSIDARQTKVVSAPIDYSKYPPNWLPEIRPRILVRDENRRKLCGLENGAIWITTPARRCGASWRRATSVDFGSTKIRQGQFRRPIPAARTWCCSASTITSTATGPSTSSRQTSMSEFVSGPSSIERYGSAETRSCHRSWSTRNRPESQSRVEKRLAGAPTSNAIGSERAFASSSLRFP